MVRKRARSVGTGGGTFVLAVYCAFPADPSSGIPSIESLALKSSTISTLTSGMDKLVSCWRKPWREERVDRRALGERPPPEVVFGAEPRLSGAGEIEGGDIVWREAVLTLWRLVLLLVL